MLAVKRFGVRLAATIGIGRDQSIRENASFLATAMRQTLGAFLDIAEVLMEGFHPFVVPGCGEGGERKSHAPDNATSGPDDADRVSRWPELSAMES